MKNRRLLLAIAVLGIVLVGRHFGAMDGFFPANARCLHCAREFYAGTGTIMCRVCRHSMQADSARQYFKQRADVPFLLAPTVKINGPVPSHITER